MVTEKGYIEKFSYVSENTGFYVFDLVTKSGKVTCVGNARGYSAGENVEVDGEYTNHPVYGMQIKVSAMRGIEPDSIVEIERYLGSGAIKGVGESLAKRIVAEFGEDTFRIALEEPEQLSRVKGISIKKAYEIGEQITEKRDARDAMMFLQKYGISQNLANKIYNKYGLSLYGVMKENPYKLAEDIKGVGFKMADYIANISGISVDSDYRVRCGILHTLSSNSVDGHTFCFYDELLGKASELLNVTEEIIDIQVTNLAMERKVIIKGDESKKVYLASFFYEELYCAKKLIELRDGYYIQDDIDEQAIESRVLKLAEKEEIILDELQLSAVVKCVKSGVFILSGGPGTGKTTTINMIIKYFEEEGLEFLLAAPTGRAAKRMSETTGYEAKTIHRLLENAGSVSDDERTAFFNRNEDNPLEADVIIIDEMSMVDIHLMRALLGAMQVGTALILVGDANQLSSVGPGEVLRDILDCERFSFERLEKIFRQDEHSHIISNAYKINSGEDIDFTEKYTDFFLLEKNDADVIYGYIEALVKKNIPKQFGIGPLDTQILTPMRAGKLGVTMLNSVLQQRLNPPAEGKAEYVNGETVFRVDDKVMQIKNNYNLEWEIIGEYNIPIDNGTGVYNGDVGRIVSINNYMKTITVLFDDGRVVEYNFEECDELELAYAITIHKSQGSEYPVIIIPILSGPKMLLTRNLLYTAVTRSQQCVILLGSKETFIEMIHTDMSTKRNTSLKERIIEVADAD